MSIKSMILGVAAIASVALPGAASAQYGRGYGQGGGYYGQSYGHQGGYDYRGDRHDRKRWEQRRRWEEKQRRREWQRAHRHHDRYDDRYDRGYRY
jgi:hypothetical protein